MAGTSIFSDFLTALGVAHTAECSDTAFVSMPFKTLFGFSRLLSQYGVKSEAYSLDDKCRLEELPVPYISRQGAGFVVVDGIYTDSDNNKRVSYILYHKRHDVPMNDFIEASEGVVLLAYPDDLSCEPDYSRHKFDCVIRQLKQYAMAALALFLLVVGFIHAGLYKGVWPVLLTLVDLTGIIVTFMLLQKSVGVHTAAAEKFCGILAKGGCDTVLKQKASTFFGIFSWSELGISYFVITTMIMMLSPRYMGALALINGCSLPFTVWSITYQKFRIKTWCTMCVTTQALLWCQFFCYLFGGYWKQSFPLHFSIISIIAVYALVLLVVNRVVTFIKSKEK